MKGKNRIGLWIIGVASIVVVGIIVLVVVTSRTPVSSEAHANIPTEWINGNELGSPDAPVVMVAYEDFLCPHCGEFNRNAKARLIEDFIEAGDLRLVYMFFPLDIFAPGSYNAARAGQCIIDLSDDPNGFWQYHDTLFFGERGASRYEVENLTSLARTAGVNEREFVECFGSVAAQDKVDQSVRAGVADGAQGTPHILINDEVFDGNAANYDAIRAAVNAALVAVE